jgi:hypothetical protein
METIKTSENINKDRRRLLGTAAMSIAVAGAASLLPAHLAAATQGDAIRPFTINIPEEQLVDLRRRIAATRWPIRKRSWIRRKACSSRRSSDGSHFHGRRSLLERRWGNRPAACG